MTKKTENIEVAEAAKESIDAQVETQPVEAPVQEQAPAVVEEAQVVSEPVPEEALAYPVAEDDEDHEGGRTEPVQEPEDTREYGENELLDQSGLFTEFGVADEHVYEPDFVNLANSRTLPWESDPYGLLSVFRETAIEAAQHVSGKDDYVAKFKADLQLLEQHVDALHEREKGERLKLIEEQAKRDEEAKKAYRTAQEQRLAELRQEAALIKKELDANE